MKKQPHQFRDLPKERLDELFSNYVISSWSYSKVSTFARNEKAFEMSYIYNMPFKKSSSSVAGNAYHSSLKAFFLELKDGNSLDIVALQKVAFDYIDEVEPKQWKVQKTTPTIEECKMKATKSSIQLLENYFKEIGTYLDDIKEILHVEIYLDEFLTVSGIDIPLPCHMMIDLVVRTKEDKIAIVDHKSQAAFSDDQELKFSVGKQAVTYALGYEARFGVRVDEVWFVENKISQNRDKGVAQMNKHVTILDDDTRRLFELLLFEPLKRMLEATSTPDYVYLINEADNFVDMAEMYEFWTRTMISEIGEFNIAEDKKELIQKRLLKIRDASLASVNPKLIKNFQANASQFIQYDLTNKNMTKEAKIEHTLRTLGVSVQVAHRFDGYSSDTFLLKVSSGTNIGSVGKYKLDIASALDVPNIRMMKDLYVHEGQSFLAIESKKFREKNLTFDPAAIQGEKIPMGIDNFGRIIYWDTANPSTPHILVCGSTGSGKSVFLISTIEYAKLLGFDEVYLLDPKREFLKLASDKIKVYNEIEDIEAVLEMLVEKMNNLVRTGSKKKILIVADELADTVSAAASGKALDIYKSVKVLTAKGKVKIEKEFVETKKSFEENLKILLQKGRSSGFRIIAATQRASVKVITGDAKVNFPVQVCFQVPKEVDSKVVIDEPGAESLAGKGDGLIKSPEYSGVVRFQAYYIKP